MSGGDDMIMKGPLLYASLIALVVIGSCLFVGIASLVLPIRKATEEYCAIIAYCSGAVYAAILIAIVVLEFVLRFVTKGAS